LRGIWGALDVCAHRNAELAACGVSLLTDDSQIVGEDRDCVGCVECWSAWWFYDMISESVFILFFGWIKSLCVFLAN